MKNIYYVTLMYDIIIIHCIVIYKLHFYLGGGGTLIILLVAPTACQDLDIMSLRGPNVFIY